MVCIFLLTQKKLGLKELDDGINLTAPIDNLKFLTP